MKKINKIDLLKGLLVGVILIASFLFAAGNLQTSYINCANYQCTAVTKIVFLNSTPLKTFDHVDVDDVVVTLEEKEESSERRQRDTLFMTVIYNDMTHQKIAKSTDEEQILSTADELRSYLENPDGAELSIALGPTGYDKYNFFIGLAFFSILLALLASWIIPRVFGPL